MEIMKYTKEIKTQRLDDKVVTSEKKKDKYCEENIKTEQKRKRKE